MARKKRSAPRNKKLTRATPRRRAARPTWTSRFEAQVRQRAPFGSALKDLLARLMRGGDPFSRSATASAGARMCVNIAAVHIPSFCDDSLAGRKPAYRNAYDLAKQNPARRVSKRRTRVDNALPLPSGQKPEDTYFGAVELTGAGIRFYGDFALILQPKEVPQATAILDRNSFELLRPPLVDEVTRRARSASYPAAMKQVAAELGGDWSADLVAMMGLKLFDSLQPRTRGVTAGMIASRVIEDEDYVEILKRGSFSAQDLQEARVTAADAGTEARIGDHLRHGPTPSISELLWRSQRRRAVSALQRAAVGTRTITTPGRVRS
jgi:hypothetical protein